MLPNDTQLLEGLKNGDNKIAKIFYQKYYPMVHFYICQNSGNEKDCEDIFQDIILILLDKLQNGFNLTSKLSTFIYSVCFNLWHQRLSRKPIEFLCDDFKDMAQDELEEQDNKYDLFIECFDRMTPEFHKVLELYIQGSSMREIAKEMGYTVKYAKTKKYICKEYLKNSIHEMCI
jgi:RNA polymerase sigma factor (sigma-70 family)